MAIHPQFDMQGTLIPSSVVDDDVLNAMTSAVRCSQVYDLAMVTVTARYADCSVWTSPCCGRSVDDRGPGWKSRPDIEWL